MACTCKDAHGNLLDSCLGLCAKQEQYQRIQAMENKFIFMFDEILLAIRNLSENIAFAKDESYCKGFKDGFDKGRDS